MAPLTTAALARGVIATSLDDSGVPRMLRAATTIPAPAGSDPVTAARAHVAALAPVYGISGAPATLTMHAVVPQTGGANIVTFDQAIDGVDVWAGRVSVLLDASQNLLAVTGTPKSASAPAARFAISESDALSIAAADRGIANPGPYQIFRARVGAALTVEYVVELYGAPSGGRTVAWRVFVDAATGAVLDRQDLVSDAAFQYRVFADNDSAGRPFDGPQQSFDPHPTGVADGSEPAFVAPNLVTMDGFNNTHDPWLAAGATSTTGNNVDAYIDFRDTQDGFTAGTDFRASTTSAGVFDRSYDTSSEVDSSQGQQMAAITNLFYINNWLHDWWYDSGFTEATGDAQVNNYGRGGVGNDPVHAEAQDDILGGSTDNANMSTPTDGMSPRMQMYVWDGPAPRSLTINNTAYSNDTAQFGPTTFDVTANVVMAVPADACAALTNNVTGKIVLVDRGTCNFDAKATRIQAAGGIGMILDNNVAGPVGTMGCTNTCSATLPPSFAISQADGTTVKGLLSGTVSAHMFRGAPGVRRDGDIDTTVVSHEWGHYLHHRLASCGNPLQCNAMSEGWGDFDALMTIVRPADDPTKTYSIGIYANDFESDPYFGIRRAPYSTSFAKNCLTFVDIGASATLPTTCALAFSGNNNEAHNAGEIWTGMLWEVYSALIQADGYTTARRAMSNYVVSSLLLSPADATYLEARDALLTAIAAVSKPDAAIAAAAFARRGAGSCAVGPARSSTTLDGVVESYTASGILGLGALTLTDDVESCDHDGILDAGEVGTLRVPIVNSGPGALSQTQIAVTTTTPGVTIVNGTRTAATVGPYSTGSEAFQVELDPSVTAQTNITFTVTLTDSTACTTTASTTATIKAEYDSVPNSSANDDVESQNTVWTQAGTAAVWARTFVSPNFAWVGTDLATVSDSQLVSPPLTVAAAPAHFVLGFQHRYQLQSTSGPTRYFDGGVIELSTDNGTTWADASTLGVTPGYNGTLQSGTGNPLAGRQAYSRQNAAYPAHNSVSLDFGTQFAGRTVLVRFRIGTDSATGASGWEIDNLSFGGITNTPFATVTNEGATCQTGPVANAGADQTVLVNSAVALDGTQSNDPDGDPLTYAWTQTLGPAVTLAAANTRTPSFTAPSSPTTLEFQIAVTDPFSTSTDRVQVFVENAPPPPDAAVIPPDASVPPDAAVLPPDASVATPDAAVGTPDAAMTGPDAGPPPPDAAAAPDARAPADGGLPPIAHPGGCCSTSEGGAGGSVALAVLVVLGVRRRRYL